MNIFDLPKYSNRAAAEQCFELIASKLQQHDRRIQPVKYSADYVDYADPIELVVKYRILASNATHSVVFYFHEGRLGYLFACNYPGIEPHLSEGNQFKSLHLTYMHFGMWQADPTIKKYE
jgi:hypothetical protein